MNSRTVRNMFIFWKSQVCFRTVVVLAFQKNDKEPYRSVQKELKAEIRKEKEQHKKEGIESNFTYNNMRRVWSGMKLMSRYM